MWTFGAEIILSSRVPKKILDTEGRVDRFMRKYGMGSLDNATSEAKPSNEESPKES
jgi:large subunit ribosomal protein L31